MVNVSIVLLFSGAAPLNLRTKKLWLTGVFGSFRDVAYCVTAHLAASLRQSDRIDIVLGHAQHAIDFDDKEPWMNHVLALSSPDLEKEAADFVDWAFTFSDREKWEYSIRFPAGQRKAILEAHQPENGKTVTLTMQDAW